MSRCCPSSKCVRRRSALSPAHTLLLNQAIAFSHTFALLWSDWKRKRQRCRLRRSSSMGVDWRPFPSRLARRERCPAYPRAAAIRVRIHEDDTPRPLVHTHHIFLSLQLFDGHLGQPSFFTGNERQRLVLRIMTSSNLANGAGLSFEQLLGTRSLIEVPSPLSLGQRPESSASTVARSRAGCSFARQSAAPGTHESLVEAECL